MSNIEMWKQETETRTVHRELEEKISEIKEELVTGALMFEKENNKIVKEYVYNIGVIEGIKFAKRKMETVEHDIN